MSAEKSPANLTTEQHHILDNIALQLALLSSESSAEEKEQATKRADNILNHEIDNLWTHLTDKYNKMGTPKTALVDDPACSTALLDAINYLTGDQYAKLTEGAIRKAVKILVPEAGHGRVDRFLDLLKERMNQYPLKHYQVNEHIEFKGFIKSANGYVPQLMHVLKEFFPERHRQALNMQITFKGETPVCEISTHPIELQEIKFNPKFIHTLLKENPHIFNELVKINLNQPAKEIKTALETASKTLFPSRESTPPHGSDKKPNTGANRTRSDSGIPPSPHRPALPKDKEASPSTYMHESRTPPPNQHELRAI